MYGYIKGKVTEIESNYIILENNDIGYLVFNANPYSFSINEEYKIYIYQNVKEDELSLYGFKSKEEKELFLKLIDVKGLGPKMALPIIATNNINDVVEAIEKSDVNYLKKFPKIGDKVARQIILDLKGKLIVNENDKIDYNEELIEALEALGYKKQDVKKIIPNVNKEEKIENQIKEALKLLLK
ncbi:MAG: Holliday junction branch migration protein RuvA [Bacilli bacterium]|nr:Holliday junction branch migration protein RuvA [Bacilli bacterium]